MLSLIEWAYRCQTTTSYKSWFGCLFLIIIAWFLIFTLWAMVVISTNDRFFSGTELLLIGAGALVSLLVSIPLELVARTLTPKSYMPENGIRTEL